MPKAAAWAEAVFEQLVELYSWGFGDKNARMIVGSVVLLFLVGITIWSAVSAFHDVSGLLVTVIKALLKVCLALLFGSMCVRFYQYAFPDEKARAEAVEAARQTYNDTQSWVVTKWLKGFV